MLGFVATLGVFCTAGFFATAGVLEGEAHVAETSAKLVVEDASAPGFSNMVTIAPVSSKK
eukprot:12572904-Alexandrium_andersonii.AAC.1